MVEKNRDVLTLFNVHSNISQKTQSFCFLNFSTNISYGDQDTVDQSRWSGQRTSAEEGVQGDTDLLRWCPRTIGEQQGCVEMQTPKP